MNLGFRGPRTIQLPWSEQPRGTRGKCEESVPFRVERSPRNNRNFSIECRMPEVRRRRREGFMSRRGYFLAEAVLAGCLAMLGNLAPSEQNSAVAKIDLAPEKLLSQPIGANW